jgi:hypothetical protein
MLVIKENIEDEVKYYTYIFNNAHVATISPLHGIWMLQSAFWLSVEHMSEIQNHINYLNTVATADLAALTDINKP